MFIRHSLNPLITPAQVRPSRSGYEVIGTFNAGAILHGDETILLVRVAERPTLSETGKIFCPHLSENGELALSVIDRDDPAYDTRDPRFVRRMATGDVYLTSISHLRLARSSNGVHFTMDDQPFLQAETPYEAYGIEDARITLIDGSYLINYTAVSPGGIATALAVTSSFEQVERKGIIFAPSNRDVVLFPHKINGLYRCYHRPMPGDFGGYRIWTATSPDLIHWGDHRVVLSGDQSGWDSGRVGGGAPPIWTKHGWLSIYHAADQDHRYCLGAFLAALDDPARVIARSATPIFEPTAPYETGGFFPNVVFTCGVTVIEDTLRLYYGASDDTVALAETSLHQLVERLL